MNNVFMDRFVFPLLFPYLFFKWNVKIIEIQDKRKEILYNNATIRLKKKDLFDQ